MPTLGRYPIASLAIGDSGLPIGAEALRLPAFTRSLFSGPPSGPVLLNQKTYSMGTVLPVLSDFSMSELPSSEPLQAPQTLRSSHSVPSTALTGCLSDQLNQTPCNTGLHDQSVDGSMLDGVVEVADSEAWRTTATLRIPSLKLNTIGFGNRVRTPVVRCRTRPLPRCRARSDSVAPSLVEQLRCLVYRCLVRFTLSPT